jgi:hypothetical protein
MSSLSARVAALETFAARAYMAEQYGGICEVMQYVKRLEKRIAMLEKKLARQPAPVIAVEQQPQLEAA